MNKLEVIVLTVEDAINAYKAGATRLELVDDIANGGISPSLQLVQEVVSAVPIAVNVMVRSRPGNFIYSQTEMNEMISYTKRLKLLGVNGVVFGSLNQYGEVDLDQLLQVKNVAANMEFTFHRAIDENPLEYKNNIRRIDGLVTNVLTSGGIASPLVENLELITSQTNNNLNILIGGGINVDNYAKVINTLRDNDFHIGTMAYKNGDFKQGIDYEAIQKVLLQIHNG